jgi:hypothetical protein
MIAGIGHQPLTEDYKASKRIIDNTFDDVCDVINNLQAQIDDLKKKLVLRNIAGSHNHTVEALIPIVTSIPTKKPGFNTLYILDSEQDRIRNIWPDGTDKGLYIPFSYL